MNRRWVRGVLFLFGELVILASFAVSNLSAQTGAHGARIHASDPSNFEIVKGDNFEGLICRNLKDWQAIFKPGSKLLVPSKSEVVEAEQAIQSYLEQSSDNKVTLLAQNLSSYKRQYLLGEKDGRKLLQARFTCRKDLLDCAPVIVDDGGSCFFEIEYDLKDKKCYNFARHGEG